MLAVRRTLLRRLTRVDPDRFGPKLAEALVTRSQQVKSDVASSSADRRRRGGGRALPAAGEVEAIEGR